MDPQIPSQTSSPQPQTPVVQQYEHAQTDGGMGKKIFMLLGLLLFMLIGAGGMYIYLKPESLKKIGFSMPSPTPQVNQNQVQPKISVAISPQTQNQIEPTVLIVDETAGWKTYQGDSFSFKYPATWENNTNDQEKNDPNNKEVVSMIISQDAIFFAYHKNFDYESGVKQQIGSNNHTAITIGGKEATKSIIDSSIGYVVNFVIRGNNNTHYQIGFNGGEKQSVPEELVEQVMGTFQFTK